LPGFFRGAAKEDEAAGNPGSIMARHHLAAALAALSLPAIAVPVAASPPPAAAATPPAEAAPAEAAPAEAPAALPAPGPVCGIRVVRAPADLREQVEDQLEADGAACQGALDVWLVPSSGGVYVQARDRAGRVRERQVPDAAIAATLIASWVEIDAAAPLWAPTPAAAATPVEPPPSPAIAAAPEVAPPPPVAPPSRAIAPSRVGATTAVVARAPAPRSARSIGVSALAVVTGSEMSGGGVRVGLDVLRWRRFDLGIALQGTSLEGDGTMRRHRNDGNIWVTEDQRDSVDGLVTLGYTMYVGRLRLHPQVAVGAGLAEHDLAVYPAGSSYHTSPNSLGVRTEAGLAVAWPLGRTWWVEAQASTGVATYEERDYTYDQAPVWLDGITSALIGLRFTP
jgi:hypothetical protein